MRLPKVIIKPHVAVFAVGLLLLDGSFLSLIPIIAAACHEAGHLLAMLILRVPIRELEFTLVGAEIRTEHREMGMPAAVVIYASGAAANFLSAGVTAAVFHGTAAEFFVLCSLTLGCLNLLPVASLDGGCILAAVLCRMTPRYMPVIADTVSAVCIFILWLAAVYALLLGGGNLSLMLLVGYLFWEAVCQR